MSLTDEDLYGKYNEIVRMKLSSYDKMYVRCVNLIKRSAQFGEFILVYKIPNILPGSEYPLINIPVCAEYIIDKFKKTNKNIKVNFYEPNYLLFDWRINK